jgi:hypothetical protein
MTALVERGTCFEEWTKETGDAAPARHSNRLQALIPGHRLNVAFDLEWIDEKPESRSNSLPAGPRKVNPPLPFQLGPGRRYGRSHPG